MDPLTLILLILAAILIAIVVVVLIRTANYAIEMPEVEPIELEEIDAEEVARHIGLAVQLKTISNVDIEKVDFTPFVGLRNLLSTLYPQVDTRLKRELINDHALLYTWEGSEPDLEPIAFAAHQDVVPANEAPDSGWTYPPFSGTVADGYVWGRGTLDCKGTLISTMEAVNNLLRAGFEPKRTIYLAFGHDEEVSGIYGAKEIAELLRQRGVKLSFLLDEGGAITRGSVPGIEAPVGLIGATEKGHLTLKLRATTAAGHASAPPPITSIGALSLAIATLENNPFPQDLEMADFTMSFLASQLPFIQRLALANQWLFGGLLKKKFAKKPSTNALTRTTIAPTVFHAGKTENVLPAQAEALVNIRIYPSESVRETYERVYKLVADKVVEVLPAHGDTLMDQHIWEPTEISDISSVQFKLLANLIRAAFPGTLVAPFMMSGATDARYYTSLSKRVFRFTPLMMTHEDQKTVHGMNERLSIESAGKSVAFMMELMRRMSSLPAETDKQVVEEEVEALSDPEEEAIRRLREPLRVKPLKEAPKPELEEMSLEEEMTAEMDEVEGLELLPDDDLPLETKPLKKK